MLPEMNQSHRRVLRLVVLFVGFCSFYMLTYSGRIESTDTLFLLDATGSLLHYGDLKLDVSAGVRPPEPGTLRVDQLYPLPDAGVEPVQPLLALPLYALAEYLPGVGIAQTVYLFNILISAGACCVLYGYARMRGYTSAVSVLAALLLGLGTIVWPYSKTFFQEPLTLLLVLLTALLVERWRLSGYRGLHWLALAVGAGGAALFSKAAAALALPALLIIAAPRLTWRRLLALLLVGAGLVGLVILLAGPLGIQGRIDRAADTLRHPGPYVLTALHSYLLSIGGSFWGTSPVILLALPGIWLARRQRQYRDGLALLALALAFAIVYAIWQGGGWFGGLSWPPRFLIPVVPFGLLAALPFLDYVLRRRGWALALVILLLVYGIWIQISGVSVYWRDYAHALPPEANTLSEWGGGLNVVRYLRWVVIPSLWPQAELDFAWARNQIIWWPFAFALLALICAGVWWRLRRGWRIPSAALIALPGTLALLVFLGLRSVYTDPLYPAPNPPLLDLVDILVAESQPDDVMLLSDLTYERFFTNYARSDLPRVVSLPHQPGEQPSPEQPPEIRSENPDVLVHRTTGPLIYALAANRSRLFLLSSSGPFIPWSVRPVERFMSVHYYPVRAWETSPQTRLIEYATVPAPDRSLLVGPGYHTDLRYGDAIRLAGYDLPRGLRYARGAVLPLSLYWLADEIPAARYTAAWFVRDASGGPVAQGWDSEPGGGFAPTDQWQPGVPVWDHRALYLPDDLAPGQYRLWVVLYAAQPDGTIENLPVSGAETVDGVIGVLPVSIEVTG
jgi:hypothetical protein